MWTGIVGCPRNLRVTVYPSGGPFVHAEVVTYPLPSRGIPRSPLSLLHPLILSREGLTLDRLVFSVGSLSLLSWFRSYSWSTPFFVPVVDRPSLLDRFGSPTLVGPRTPWVPFPHTRTRIYTWNTHVYTHTRTHVYVRTHTRVQTHTYRLFLSLHPSPVSYISSPRTFGTVRLSPLPSNPPPIVLCSPGRSFDTDRSRFPCRVEVVGLC